MAKREPMKLEYDDRGINVKLLEKVERRIRRHPENYNQRRWFRSRAVVNMHGDDDPTVEAVLATKHFTGPVCGTTACVAGHALVISGHVNRFTRPGEARVNGVYRRVKLVDFAKGGMKVLFNPRKHLDWLAEWLFNSDRVEATMPDVLRAIRRGEVELTRSELDRLEDKLVGVHD